MSQSLNALGDSVIVMPPDNTIPAWKKLTQIKSPAPAQAFVFIDEHPDTLLDAQFGNPVGIPFFPQIWFDKPADRHNRGSNLSFADGHAERWHWSVSKSPAYAGQPIGNGEMPDFVRVQGAMKMWADPKDW
jgi:prepilin-type processing-associated H-X9-DG protein